LIDPRIRNKFNHFFFQEEDSIRDFHVTGVQTCALPISSSASSTASITMVMMRLPPGVPRIATLPSHSTKVGVIDDSGRLYGAMALASLPTRPYTFAVPGLAEKSSISLLSN